MAQHELRVIVVIPLDDDAMTRSKQVAGFEPIIEALNNKVTALGGQVVVNVVKAKPRAVREVAATVAPVISSGNEAGEAA